MRWFWTLGFAAACMSGYAQAEGDAQCRAPVPHDRPLANRSETIASMERLPESCLQAILVACNDGANRTILDLGSAAMCSMGYEALLRKGFGGSFPAMLMWWERTKPEQP